MRSPAPDTGTAPDTDTDTAPDTGTAPAPDSDPPDTDPPDTDPPDTDPAAVRPDSRGGWLRRLLPFVLHHPGNVALAVGAAIIGMVVGNVLPPLIEKVILDNVIVARSQPLAPWLAALIGAGIFSFGAGFVRRYRGGRVALDAMYDLQTAIFEHLQRLDFARHDEMQTGQLVSRANSDVTLLQGLLSFLPMTLGNLVTLVASLGVMLYLSPLLALVAVTAVPVIAVISLRLRSNVFPASWDAQQRAGEVAGVVDEAVTGVRVVKAFGQERRELDRLTDTARGLYSSRVRSVRIRATLTALLQVIPALAQVAVLALGGWLAYDRRITLGTFLAFSSYVLLLVAPVRQFALLVTIAQQAKAGAGRILDLLDANPLVTEKPAAEALATVEGAVRFEAVGFGYSRSQRVLDRFTLSISPGETVALVGPPGSGKSTVALLLPRFYDVSAGTVSIDGVDVADVTLDSLRHQVGVVFEESFLFSDTVASNIAYGRPDATPEQIERAARAAEAHAFIEALPDGYLTVVGDRGLSLSGGQRQRIALARALLTDPRILILDDATSAVDAGTEEEIHATLRRLMLGRTTLLIAHRRSTLRLASRIVVVDKGKVADQGTHEELMGRSPLYRRLLTGPGEDCEGEGDDLFARGPALAGGPAPTDPAPTDPAPTDPAPAPTDWDPAPRRIPFRPAAPTVAAKGGGGAGSWGVMLAPTPKLLATLETLPPANDDPHVDTEALRAHDPRFSLRRFAVPFRRPLGIGLGLVVVDTLLTLAGPYLVKTGIDSGVLHHSALALWGASAAYLVVTLLDGADTWVQGRYTGRTAERMLFALRIRIFSHLSRLGMDFYEREMPGRVMTRMTTDVDALGNLLQTGLISALVNLCTFVGVAAFLLVMNVRLTLVAFAVVPPLFVATFYYKRASQRAYSRARERIAAVNANLQENISGVRVSQAFSHERRNMTVFNRLAGDYRHARLDAQRLVSIYFPFVLLLSDVAAAVVLGVGAGLVQHRVVLAGTLIAFVLYLAQMFSPIQQLSQTFDQWQQARASMVKIGELMAVPISTPEAPDAVDPGRLGGALRFEDVRFAYPGSHELALRGIDLDIEAGETVALVGETGAGKSTVVKLAARFYDPIGGRVLADGHDLTSLDLAAYRHELGYVPQEAFLFDGSVRDNIAYGRPEATDADVQAAAEDVGAHDVIVSLPGGYGYQVSERGRALSAGYRQLIALARARLVDPAILLLDEATSNLDLATEARVSRAMGVLARGRTTLVIAHRLQTAQAADRIVVIDDGLVVEQGGHAELLARGERYAAMWRSFDLEAEAV
ncbi:MAG: ABC transporter ATP-binding protein [Acidimicrobiales bacterium]